jgi:hypothetical protein
VVSEIFENMGEMNTINSQRAAPGSAQEQYAEQAATTIVGVMKDLANGKALDLSNPAIRKAFEYSRGKSMESFDTQSVGQPLTCH